MSIPINYVNTQYVSAMHTFKTIPSGTNFPLNLLANTPTCNVMTFTNATIGIGITTPRQLLDIQGGDMIASGNIGIGTTIALQSLHIQNQSYFVGNIGIGTTHPLASLHVQNESYFAGNIGIGTTLPSYRLHVQGNMYTDKNIRANNIGTYNNRIINGDMRLSAYNYSVGSSSNFGLSNLIGTVNPLDRFYLYGSTGGKLLTRMSQDAPTGFTRSLQVTSLSNITPVASDQYGVYQTIEGFNMADFLFGTADAETISVSFWAKSSVTGTYSLRLANGDLNRSYIQNYSISSVNTWTYVSASIPGCTSGIWNSESGTGLQLYFDLGGGSTYEATANTWLNADDQRTSDAVRLIGTQGATWFLTGVQLEKGSLATPFNRRPFLTELKMARESFSALDNRSTYGTTLPMQVSGYLDLAAFNGSLKGIRGGFTDGRYGYFVPYYNGSYYGIVTRIDLQNFTASGITILDVSTAGNTNAKTFIGGFTDGRYGYLVPWAYATSTYSGILTRIDLQNFTTSGVSYLDVSTAGNTGAKGFHGGFTDGRYGYLVPNSSTDVIRHGILTRVDLQNFTTSGVSYLDVSTAGNTGAKGFIGGFTDGRYGYLMPYYNGAYHGILTRVDLQNFTTSGVSYLDVSTAGNTGAKGFVGGFTDGRYGYLIPFINSVFHGILTRVDLQNFTTSGVTYLDVSTAGNTAAKGFTGGFTDGRYGYLVPYANTAGVNHGILTRVDLQNFTISGVSYLDVSAAGNTGAKGFYGGFTDGRYGYLIPTENGGAYHGIVARVQLADTLIQNTLTTRTGGL